MKLGSLFSGSGGFELAGVLCGIEPVFASEIEPYQIRVTTARFPGMKHLGDVRVIDGAKVEPVDVITFGSPCQDLSVAGKQAGIHEGERSNLFFEAIRIIKEMRDGTAVKFPRFAVWENVCFTKDTLVTCENGYKKISDIAVGDRVKTLNSGYCPVKAVYKTKNQRVMSVSVSGSEDIICTKNHPFYAREKLHNGNERYFTAPHWCRADELTADSMVAYRIDEPTLPEDFMDAETAWAVGRWIADGSVDLSKSTPRMFISVG